MFTVIFHDEAEKEFFALPATIRAKMSRLLEKLEANPRLLRDRIQNLWGMDYLKYGPWDQILRGDSGFTSQVNVFFY